MLYLFGAGSNCQSVIGFVGQENVKAIVDNDSEKTGSFYQDCKVINFEMFLNQYNDEVVIISSWACKEAILCQLREAGIKNVLVFPQIQTSYYSAKKIISDFISNENEIVFIGDKTLGEILILLSGKQMEKLRDFSFDKWDNVLNESKTILIFEDDLSSNEKNIISKFSKVVWVNKIINEKYQKIYDKMVKFKNIHKGESCFIIGNGPSLRLEDIEKINREKIKTFGCNKIFKIYDTTSWRPDYYAASDGMLFKEYQQEIENHEAVSFIKHFVGYENNYKVYQFRYQEKTSSKAEIDFTDDITKCIFRSATVVYDLLQIAVYMGFKTIYLIGVDCNYIKNSSANYFFNDGKVDSALHRVDDMIIAYISAKKYADSHGIKIYNATRGGKLEVFERVDFDSLFKE